MRIAKVRVTSVSLFLALGCLSFSLVTTNAFGQASKPAAGQPSVEAMVGATATPRWAKPDAKEAEAVLMKLRDTDTPEKIYAGFNEFCRTHFGAETEPMLYKLYGDKLAFVKESTWSHVSENSASLAWETNLPAVSFVEYGESNKYGKATPKTDRQYYQHLHHLTGLDVGKTYHYRFVGVDERGNKFESPDQTLTTTKIKDAIYIPGSMKQAPYKLDKAGATYVLTEDLTVPGNAIETVQDDITLDLNGHTIVYAEQATVAKDCVGIIVRGGEKTKTKYQGNNVKVLNGTVRQGQGDMLQKNKSIDNFMCLALTGQSLEMAGITVDYWAPSVWGVRFSNSQGDINIHHNFFMDRGAVIVDRGSGAVRTLGFRFPKESPNKFQIHHNLIARTRQNGFGMAHSMYNNEVYVDSWSTNSFAMQPESVPGIDAGEHYNNKIFATGFNPYGFGWAHENLKVHDNLIHMHGVNVKPRWNETWGDINMLEALRITNYGSGGQVRNNLQYWKNTIILRGGDDCEMRGTGFYSDISIKGTVCRDSYFKVEALDTKTNRAACIDPQGQPKQPDCPPVSYTDNTLESNIHLIRFGDHYGVGHNAIFARCKFVKLGNNPLFHTFMFDGGNTTTGHVLLDCEFGPGTAYNDVYWYKTSTNSYYSVAWTLDLTTAPGAAVTVKDKDGKEVFTGKADDKGKVAIPLTQCTIRPAEWKKASEASKTDKHQEENFTPHTVTVDAGGKTASKTVEMKNKQALELKP